MQFYLAAGAGDVLPRGRYRPVRADYRVGPRLLSALGSAQVQGGLMLVADSRECGEDELLALAQAALRVLNGEEQAQEY